MLVVRKTGILIQDKIIDFSSRRLSKMFVSKKVQKVTGGLAEIFRKSYK